MAIQERSEISNKYFSATSASDRNQLGHRFVKVTGDSPYFEKVREVFLKNIEPLYGDQTKALTQIYQSTDRSCELLLDENKTPLGVIVYKNDPQDEFQEEGIQNSLEIKTLIVVDPEKNSGKGCGSLLMKRIFDVASEHFATGVHVTVSESVKDPLPFFQKKGFQIVKTWDGRYFSGIKEYLLYQRSNS